MKKLILILFLLFPVLTYGQIVDGENISWHHPMPTYIAGGDTAFIWASDTITSTNIDTVIKYAYYTLTNLNTMFKQYYRFTVTADSTIQISPVIAFTTGRVFTVNTGESLTPPNTFDPTVFTQLYIKRGSAITGTTTWRIIVSGR